MYTVFGAKVVDDKDDVAYKEQHSPLQGAVLLSPRSRQMQPVYNTFSYLLKVLLNSGAIYLDLYILLRVHLSERSEFGP